MVELAAPDGTSVALDTRTCISTRMPLQSLCRFTVERPVSGTWTLDIITGDPLLTLDVQILGLASATTLVPLCYSACRPLVVAPRPI